MSTKLSRCNFLSIRKSYVFYKSLHTACSDIFLIKHTRAHTHTHTHTHTKQYTQKEKPTSFSFLTTDYWAQVSLLPAGKKHTHTKKFSSWQALRQADFSSCRSHSHSPVKLKQLAFPRGREKRPSVHHHMDWNHPPCIWRVQSQPLALQGRPTVTNLQITYDLKDSSSCRDLRVKVLNNTVYVPDLKHSVKVSFTC